MLGPILPARMTVKVRASRRTGLYRGLEKSKLLISGGLPQILIPVPRIKTRSAETEAKSRLATERFVAIRTWAGGILLTRVAGDKG